jgi:nifR3 family TIM-barrel protein
VDDATDLTTTVKIRSGFDQKSRDPVAIGLRCQDAGAKAICLHPRTRADMYSGEAQWSEIRDLVEALDIPVIGNGDITSGEDARRMRDETGCAAIMIARGSHGDPWMFAQARAALDGDPILPDPSVEERFQICLEHARNAIAFESNPDRAIIDFRKHLGWYTKGLPSGRLLRIELFQSETLDDVERLLEGYLDEHRAGATV